MKKKVLVVAPTYWPEGSGGTLATHLIIKHLSQVGRFDLAVLTGTRSPEIVPGVRYIVDPFVKLVEKKFSIRRLVQERYCNLIEKYDVIYTVYAYTFIPVAKKLGKRVIVHLHDYRPVSPSSVILANQAENPTLSKLALDSFKVKWFERKALKSLFLNIGEVLRTPLIAKWVSEADVVIAVSRRHAELLATALPPLRNKLVVVYNPPPPIPRIKREPGETPVFLYVGGESYLKGFYVLIETIEMVLKEGIRVKFIFTNKYSGKVQRIILGINKIYGNVIYLTGRIPYTEVLNLYKRAWALLFPSIWEEPLPYSVVESILLQTTPIASKVGGIPELLSPFIDDTLLVKPGDVKALQERIIRLSSLQKGELHDQIVYLSDVGEYLLDKLHESSRSLSLIIAGE